MNKISIMALLICTLVSGCGPGYYWYKHDAFLEEAETACKQCYMDSKHEQILADHIAKQDAQVTQMTYIPEAENEFSRQSQDIGFRNCMKAKGYREISGDFLKPSLRTKFCNPTPDRSFSIAGK